MTEQLPYSHLTKGSLLIASPDIDDSFYFRSVMLLCEHSTGGSFGLIVNKSLEVELPEEIIDLKDLQNPHVHVRAGGPIQPNQMMLIHSSDKIPDQTIEICPGVFLGGDVQFLQEAVSDANGPHILLCFGYCGWGPGDLEREFLDGDWFLHPATAPHIFEHSPDKLWQSTLREMGGKYATLSMIPEDLSLN